MKKKKIICVLLVAIICISCVLISIENNQFDKGHQNSQMTFIKETEPQKVDTIDSSNKTNISFYEEIPIVSQELLDKGISGGEGGQWPLCIAGDNIDGSLIFYGTDVGGIFKSVDGGNSWKKSNIGLFSNGICDIEIDPNNKNNVVCFGVNGGRTSYTTGMYYSTNAGDSWHFSKHFPINGHRNVVESVAFDPTSYDKGLGGSSILYLSLIEKLDITTSVLTDENKGLHKSCDGGRTWVQINKDLGDSIVKVDSNGVLFCGNYNGLFVSHDKGLTFETIISGNITGLDVVGDTAYILENSTPNDDGKETYAKIFTYCGDELSLISTLTGGDKDDPYGGNVNLISESWQWHYVKGGSDEKCLYHFTTDAHKVYTIKVSPVNPNNMVLIYTNTLYYENASHTVLYSKDGGKTFNISLPNKLKTGENGDFNMLPYSNRKMDFYWSPIDENIVFDFENDWLSVSKNGGQSFYYSSNGINGIMCGGKFYFNHYNSDIMFFGSQDYCGAFTTDGGKTWKFVNLSKDNPLNDGANVYGGYAASDKVLFGVFAPRNYKERYLTISFNGGETTTILLEENRKITSGYIRPDGVSRMAEQANYSSYQSVKDKNVLFCADLRSDDFGQNWSKMSGVTGVYASDSENGDLYGINDTLGQVVKSSDDGLTWSVVANSTDIKKWWSNAYISDLAFDSNKKIIYITCQWGGLFAIYQNENNKIVELTSNIPKQFEEFPQIAENLGSDTFFQTRLTTVSVDPNNPDIIYVGGANYKYRSDCSLFRSCDGGQTFYCINANATNSIVSGIQGGAEPLCVRVNQKTGEMWCAGNCLGFSKITPPYETEKSLSKQAFQVDIIDEKRKITKTIFVRENRFVVLDEMLTLDGYEFCGYFKYKNFNEIFNEKVTSNTIIYVKWQKK